ncbi:uncharacterized protein LOC129232346 [Uloborus diversus]|uniref:uncharacterized protein LOC129232346 n=1 Tax=Uloborus diversus TaxID=327109 RepID=UPI002409E40F|nr:uncharacterized protein LOC129232346 [Uloborus diversus]
MEEVYVIKLRGVPSTSTSESSSSTTDPNDLIRSSILGLGVLHIVFGVLVLTFGSLRTAVEHEPNATLMGILFGPVFVACGICGFISWKRPYRKLKIRAFFGLASLSMMGSVSYIGLCLLGVVQYHGIPREFGDSPHVTANALLATMGEFIVSLLSILTSGGALWKRWGFFRPSVNHQRQKVIVKTDIVGGVTSPEKGDTIGSPHPGAGYVDEVIRHVSPHCVISLRATDEQKEVIRRVQEYLHSQDELSFSFSDPSSIQEEQDLGLDSQSWKNEVLVPGQKMLQSKNEDVEISNQ